MIGTADRGVEETWLVYKRGGMALQLLYVVEDLNGAELPILLNQNVATSLLIF